jgi:type IV pilus assembly protein PilN
MIKINLLPYREKEKKENIQRQIIIFAGILVVLLVLLSGVYLYLNIRVNRIEDDIKAKDLRLAELTKKIGDIEKFKKDKSLIERKLAVIGKLEGNRLAQVKRMVEMTRIVPGGDMWLERMAETGNNLRIEGVARNSMTVALFMRHLESADFVRSVDLVSSKEREMMGVKLQQFIVTCVMAKES